MSRRLVTISYTALDAGGGVPKFNRSLHAAFPDRECLHFCWESLPWCHEVDSRGETEWGRAWMLNHHLVASRLVSPEDVVVADGFWVSGLEHFPLAVSHSHGIWSHLTHEDVLAGKQPDMPAHHVAQVAFRRKWHRLGKPMTAVSAFISNELSRQWGITVDRTINNGVDTDAFAPANLWTNRNRPLVIHGVNDRFNSNKGWDHIRLLHEWVDADVWSLDEACERFRSHGDQPWTKANVLSQADLFVHPSGYEGNSMMCCEALACGVPFVGYNVGLAWWLQATLTWSDRIGAIMNRDVRSPDETLFWVQRVLQSMRDDRNEGQLLRSNARLVALAQCSSQAFQRNWRDYIETLERKTENA